MCLQRKTTAKKQENTNKNNNNDKKAITTITIKEYCHVRNWEFVWDYKQENKG